jgi:hypothetical protein
VRHRPPSSRYSVVTLLSARSGGTTRTMMRLADRGFKGLSQVDRTDIYLRRHSFQREIAFQVFVNVFDDATYSPPWNCWHLRRTGWSRLCGMRLCQVHGQHLGNGPPANFRQHRAGGKVMLSVSDPLRGTTRIPLERASRRWGGLRAAGSPEKLALRVQIIPVHSKRFDRLRAYGLSHHCLAVRAAVL